MTQAIGYVRRSTDRQEESLDQQKAQLATFADAKGWTLAAIYEDDAVSGSELHRQGLEALLQHAAGEAKGKVDVVVMWDRNRLARPKDALDGMNLEREIQRTGVQIVYASTGKAIKPTFADQIVGMIEHHQNGDYLRKLSRDTMRGTVARAKRGLWAGGPAPFGYDRAVLGPDNEPLRIVRSRDDGGLDVLDARSGAVLESLPKGQSFRKQDHESTTLIPSTPERVAAVARLFQDCAAGVPMRKLRDSLNESGFRTSRGNHFTNQTLTPMLANPCYLGRCVYNRRTWSKWHRYEDGRAVERSDEGYEKRPEQDWIVVEDAWPALVGKDLFDEVQRAREDSRNSDARIRGGSLKGNFLLTGLFYCGTCGGKMVGRVSTSGKAYRTRYYICGTAHAGHKDRCPKQHHVPADLVEQHVLGLVKDELHSLAGAPDLVRLVRQELDKLSGGRASALTNHQRELARLDQQTAKLRDHLLTVTPELAESIGLYGQGEQLAQRKRDVEAKIQQLQDELPALHSAGELTDRIGAALSELERVFAAATLEEKRLVIRQHIQRIESDPAHKDVKIAVLPAIFSKKIAGADYITEFGLITPEHTSPTHAIAWWNKGGGVYLRLAYNRESPGGPMTVRGSLVLADASKTNRQADQGLHTLARFELTNYDGQGWLDSSLQLNDRGLALRLDRADEALDVQWVDLAPAAQTDGRSLSLRWDALDAAGLLGLANGAVFGGGVRAATLTAMGKGRGVGSVDSIHIATGSPVPLGGGVPEPATAALLLLGAATLKRV